MFRPDNPLAAQLVAHLPIAYHGRANSIVVSGTAVRRPSGQYLPRRARTAPVFRPHPAARF